jgi:hypothetical protein
MRYSSDCLPRSRDVLTELVEKLQASNIGILWAKPKAFATGHIGEAVPKLAAGKCCDPVDEIGRHENRRGKDWQEQDR